MLEWMAWTPLTATFFLCIAGLLVAMSLLEKIVPTVPRAGLLRITTTRGERLFIALLVTGWINLLWLAFTDMSQWGALATGLVASVFILWRG